MSNSPMSSGVNRPRILEKQSDPMASAFVVALIAGAVLLYQAAMNREQEQPTEQKDKAVPTRPDDRLFPSFEPPVQFSHESNLC